MARMTEDEKRAHAKATIKGRAEPDINILTYRQDILNYMNYHNTSSEDKDRRKWVIYGMKAMERESDSVFVERATDYELHQLGPLMHARDRDMYLENQHLSFIDSEVNRLVAKYKDKKATVVEEKPTGPTVDDKAEIVAKSAYSEDIQGEVDNYVMYMTSQFSMKAYLISNNMTPLVAQKIGVKLVPSVLEIKSAYENKDPQLTEGYSHWPRVELRKYLAFLQSILQDCVDHSQVAKAMRKPRVSKKPKKSPVAKLKYQASLMEFNLRSIDPATILGANEFYAYRTNRKFIYYKAKAGETLQISGQTILNYDEEASGSKTVRKPEDFFANFNTGKKAIRELFDKLTSTKGSAPPRISEDVILVKAFV